MLKHSQSLLKHKCIVRPPNSGKVAYFNKQALFYPGTAAFQFAGIEGTIEVWCRLEGFAAAAGQNNGYAQLVGNSNDIDNVMAMGLYPGGDVWLSTSVDSTWYTNSNSVYNRNEWMHVCLTKKDLGSSAPAAQRWRYRLHINGKPALETITSDTKNVSHHNIIGCNGGAPLNSVTNIGVYGSFVGCISSIKYTKALRWDGSLGYKSTLDLENDPFIDKVTFALDFRDGFKDLINGALPANTGATLPTIRDFY